LNSELFIQQLDIFQIEMSLYDIPSLRPKRKQIFDWLKTWIHNQDSEMLEKFMIFITGSSYFPLERKITVF